MSGTAAVVMVAACQCMSDGAVTCDPITGSCQCQPGVTGPNCNQCLPRWIMVENEGCRGMCTTLRLSSGLGLNAWAQAQWWLG